MAIFAIGSLAKELLRAQCGVKFDLNSEFGVLCLEDLYNKGWKQQTDDFSFETCKLSL